MSYYDWDENSIQFQNKYAIGSIKLTTNKLSLIPPPDSFVGEPKCWENSGNRTDGITQCNSSNSNRIKNKDGFYGNYDANGPNCAPDYTGGTMWGPPIPPDSGIPYPYPAAKWPCANYSLILNKSTGTLFDFPNTVCKNGLVQDPLGCPNGYDNIFRHVKSTSKKNKNGIYSLGSIFSTVCAKEQSVGQTCVIGKYGTARCLSNDCRQQCIDSNKICKSNTEQSACLLDPLKTYPDNMNPMNCGSEFNCVNENPNWELDIDVNNIKNYKKGWVICEFYYDFSLNTYFIINNFVNWISDIFKGDDNKILPYSFSIPLIVRAYIFNAMYINYSYMYNTIHTDDFNFHEEVNFFKNGFKSYLNYLKPIADIISVYKKKESTIYLGKIIHIQDKINEDDELNKLIKYDFFQIPIYNLESNCFSITINQYQFDLLSSYNNVDDQDNLISQFMDYFLMNTETQPSQILKLHILSQQTTINTVKILYKGDDVTYTTGTYPVNTTDLDEDEFIVSYTLFCEVKRWSHMLIIYFQYLLNKNIIHVPPLSNIENLCSKMFMDSGFYSISCVDYICKNDPECFIKYSKSECKKKITPGYNIIPGEYVFDRSNDNCDCLSSNLAPVSAPQYNNLTAMCFSNTCNNDKLKKEYGLSDEYCKTQCPTIFDWIHSTNPSSRIQNWGSLNDSRYNNLCKDVFKESPSGFNWKMCIYISILTVVLSYSTFRFLNHRKISKLYVIFWTFFVFSLFLVLAIYSGFELYGISYCNGLGKNEYMHCKSGITKKDIPLYFCKIFIPCECVGGNDCGDKCRCLSGICVPKNSNDVYKYDTKYITQLNIITFITLSIISLFILRCGWYYFPKQWLILSSIVVFLIMIVYLLSLEHYSIFINTSAVAEILPFTFL